ncbi:hypothetical protein [Streptomyces sp. CBMA156]|uniref:hypothetical protein n=1 Tax=Streptomyces sp. CBMA156 TaxID=1930280 RepID=UPI0016618E36|nr:hypothetical protein [Streptomyces sp. CBMA156]MBD0675961.1 hypothetical protein [Streptomyces sp. CBMA156]
MRASRAAALAALVLTAGTVLPTAPAALAAQATAAQAGPAGPFYSISPVRVLDTRAGVGATAGPIGPDGVITLNITQAIHADHTPTAVVMNLTAVDPTGDSYLTAYPGGTERPTASTLNVSAGRNVTTNRVTVQVAPDGTVSLYNHVGSVHLVADVQGIYQARGSDTNPGSTYLPGKPARLLDTRTAIGDRQGPVGAGADKAIAADVSSVTSPTDGDTELVLQLTATEATQDSHVKAYAGGPWSRIPETSDLNFAAGQTVTNLTSVDVGRDGLGLYNNAGQVNLVVDYVGRFRHVASHPEAADHGLFVPTPPTRVLDTRTGLGNGGPAVRLGPGGNMMVKVTGLPGAPANASAVVLNLTGTNATGDGHVTAYRYRDDRPNTSSLNYRAGRDVSSMTVVPVDSEGFIELYNPHDAVDLVADVEGFYTS